MISDIILNSKYPGLQNCDINFDSNDTLVYIVRHGESIGNKERKFLGHTDLDLTDLGYSQASKTAECLSSVSFDKIYSSDLIRAYNTASPNADIHKLPIETSARLREIFAGEWENKKVEYIIENYHNDFTVMWRTRFSDTVIPGGESVKEAGERFGDTLTELCLANRGKILLIASHAAVIRSFVGGLLELNVEDYSDKLPFPTNASFSVVRFNGSKFELVSYSNDSHLDDLRVPLMSFSSDKEERK